MILSFDPGIDGAGVVHESDGTIREWFKLPVEEDKNSKCKVVSFRKLKILLEKYSNENVMIIHEIVTEHFQGGRKSSFTFGRNYQVLLDAIDSLGYERIGVQPKKWQDLVFKGIEKVYEINPKTKRKKHLTKQTALKAKDKYYPGLKLFRTERCSTEDDGLVDALLIGKYFFLKY